MKIKIVLAILFPLVFYILSTLLDNLDFNNNDELIRYNLSYYKESKIKKVDKILDLEFKKFPESKSFGIKNGTYWIRLDLPKTLDYNNFITYLPTHNIHKIEVYKKVNNSIEFLKVSGNYFQKSQIEFNYQFPSFTLDSNPNEVSSYFFKVLFLKEANFPVKILNKEDFIDYRIKKNTINSIYFGTCIVIILINLFLYIKLLDKVYLYYSLFLICLIAKFLLYDGSFINFFRGTIFYYYLEPLIHFLGEIIFLSFSIKFLNLNNKYPKKTKWLFVFPIIVFLLYLIYIYTNNYIFTVIADSFGVLMFPLLWLLAFENVNKNESSKVYVIGYILFVPVAVYFILGYPLGFWEVNGDMLIVKIASWLDILVFTYAIWYRLKNKLNQNEKSISNLLNLLESAHSDKNNVVLNYKPYLALLKSNEVTEKPLTIREVDILEHLISGSNNKTIADVLFISTNTVKSHIRNIYSKLEVSSREELKEKMKLVN